MRLPKLAFLLTKKMTTRFTLMRHQWLVIYPGNTMRAHVPFCCTAAFLEQCPYTLNLQKLLFLPCGLELRIQAEKPAHIIAF